MSRVVIRLQVSPPNELLQHKFDLSKEELDLTEDFVAQWPELGIGDSKEYTRHRLKQVHFHLMCQESLKEFLAQLDFEPSWHLSPNSRDGSIFSASSLQASDAPLS